MTTRAAGSGLPFTKGHGTQNDFVLVPDSTAPSTSHPLWYLGWLTGGPASAATA